ncbi:hypothetical protein DV451_004515 [Geotrichum candidum]|uniref:Similar to Saccharomyces cerevisiae YNL121C TOM70 Component of the TOM (Translocase of outer membrane) complex responsible for recognition and initial import steps for all mitochondrially proteins n=1 Tax=Geotrichum candidum TaxID=1173061 RepID=A0A0J9XHP4_GEOCN|nr:hypothetical protein DV451_004515 [Geotrichum candidum]KAI9213191.1 hypothetical protein DS838_001915 [Geotrichum bryndzae]KAF5106710.1 hypothetical protein DV453_003670 [Geotrichum candidum]KAF5113769.1 hypothetical protein DV454_003387 [Geotrichum candidum]KAF5118508.1 hypothetical protein DV452_002024 [Geotrichum candidum]
MSSQATVWDKVTGFATAHKVAVFVGSAVVVGSGAGAYYYYTKAEAEKPAVKPKGRKKPSKHDKKKSKRAREAEAKGVTLIAGYPLVKDGLDIEYPDVTDFEAVKNLSDEDRELLAHHFKLAGNNYFAKKLYDQALDFYSRGLKCDENPILYSNQAACYNSLQKYDKVIEAANKALALQPDNEKCIMRRAAANEKLENYRDALFDYTSVLILNNFASPALNSAVDRVLATFSQKEAKEILANKPKTLPSQVSVSSTLASYGTHEAPEGVKSAAPGSSDYELKLAFEDINTATSESYNSAFEHLKKAVETETEYSYLAYVYLSIFTFLAGDAEESLNQVMRSIELKPTQIAHVVRANLYLDQQNVAATTLDFQAAVSLNPETAFVYHHIGQVEFISGEINDSIENYKKVISLDPGFILSHIQLAVSYYRLGDVKKSNEYFENLEAEFPHSYEVFNYHGEILVDTRKYDEACEKFDKSIENSIAAKSIFHSLPLVNKALAKFNTPGSDTEDCITLCKEALEVDPTNEIAQATLAQIYLQAGKLQEGYDALIKSAKNSRTNNEIVQQLNIAEATLAQMRVLEERPFLKERLEAIQKASSAYASK